MDFMSVYPALRMTAVCKQLRNSILTVTRWSFQDWISQASYHSKVENTVSLLPYFHWSTMLYKGKTQILTHHLTSIALVILNQVMHALFVI